METYSSASIRKKKKKDYIEGVTDIAIKYTVMEI